MNRLGEFLAAHGPMLLIGATALLSAGTAALLLQRSPIHRQRIAEMTVLCVLAWLVLACVPMRRWSPKAAATTGAAPGVIGNKGGPAVSDLPSDWQSVLASLVRPAESTPQRPADRVSPDVSAARAALSAPPSNSTPAPVAGRSRAWHVAAPTAVVWAYIGGAAGCAAWLLLGHALLWRVTRRARVADPWLSELFRGACRAVGVRRARVLVVSAPLRPVSCGLLRPTVLLGHDDCAQANRPRLRQVLLHEAAHLRQRDAWGNALFNLAMPLLYFHPLYWVLRSRASLAREMVADDTAAASTSRAAYARDLLELARARSGYRPAPLAAVGIFRSPSHFYRRMHMLMQRNIRLDNRCSTAWRLASGVTCVGALFAASATIGVRSAAAQESPKQVEIKQEKLDRELLDARAVLKQAIADREAFLKQAKADRNIEDPARFQVFATDANQVEVDLQVARNKFGEKSPQVAELATRLQAMRNIEKKQLADRREVIADRQAELDSRVALAQKDLDEVQAAQQSVRSAADDDEQNSQDGKEQAIRRRAEMDAKQAREEAVRAEQDAMKAKTSVAENEKIRQMLETRLRQSEAQMAQLRAQLDQVQAQMKMATAQAQQEIERAHKMVKEQIDKADRNFSATADQVRQKVDRIIRDKLANGGLDSGKGGELEELVRRTYLDVAGRLPTPDERIATEQALKEHLHDSNLYMPKSAEPTTDPRRKVGGRATSDGAQLNAAVGGLRPQLDLVALANSYADAIGGITAAQEELNSGEPHERAAAKAKLASAEQKARLLRAITQAALAQAKEELAMERERVKAGMAQPNEAMEAEGRVRILSLILQSSPDGKSSALQRE